MSRESVVPRSKRSPEDQPNAGSDDESFDAPWRERVVARSLGPATQQSIDRARALIDAALQLLESSGENITVQDVADRAGFSLRILYRHFKSKDDLLAAVLEEQLQMMAQHIRLSIAAIDDPVERLAEFVRLSIRRNMTPLEVALAKQEVLLLLSHPHEAARAQIPLAELGQELVREAVDADGADPGIAEHAAYSIMTLKRAFNRSRMLGDDFGLPLPSEEEMVAQCLRLLGLGGPPAREPALTSEPSATATRSDALEPGAARSLGRDGHR